MDTNDKQPAPVRERLIAAGLDLFYQHGFHAVGLDRVIERVGTTKTTFYNHFESKDALALACIETRDRVWRVRFPELLRERAGADPVAQLHEVFRLWRDWFTDLHFRGCIFIHACSEFPSPNDPCHVAARENVLALRDTIADLADQAGIANADSFAAMYSLIMQGAIVTEVIHRENEAADTAAEIARVLIRDALSTGVKTCTRY